nr:hypothetical protein [Tanacetum cinerariifolium]
AVTYTFVYIDSELGRVFWGADEELSDGGSLRVIVYRYDGLPMLPSDLEEDPKEYEDDETDDGLVDYPMDGGDDGDDDDGNSSGYDTSISLPPEAGVKRLLAMPTPSPSPLTSLSPPSVEEHLARCTTLAALPSPPLLPSLYPPPPVDRRDDIPESKQPTRKRLCLSTLGSRYEVGESSTWGRGVNYGFADTVEAKIRH